MFISPQKVINEGWITHPECKTYQDWEDKKFVSPNAIDFTLDNLQSVNVKNTFSLSETNKTHRGTTLVPLTDGVWHLREQIYDGMSDMYVEIPEGIVSWLVPRSTLNRNGLFLMSGIYDSFFLGHIGFVMYNMGGLTTITKSTRVGQIIFAESENAKKYEGGYNTDKGQHWNE